MTHNGVKLFLILNFLSISIKLTFLQGIFSIFALLGYVIISVRSWNFKYGGSLKASFLAKNQHTTKEKSLKNPYE